MAVPCAHCIELQLEILRLKDLVDSFRAKEIARCAVEGQGCPLAMLLVVCFSSNKFWCYDLDDSKPLRLDGQIMLRGTTIAKVFRTWASVARSGLAWLSSMNVLSDVNREGFTFCVAPAQG